jgi:hypothetical protein
MNAIDAILLNLQETRRRSIKAWRALPDEWLSWRPDEAAMTFGEMIRHVWSGSYYYHQIIRNNGSLSKETSEPAPFEQFPIVSVEEEISLSAPNFKPFSTTLARSLRKS